MRFVIIKGVTEAEALASASGSLAAKKGQR
jgi:hypothetical protein